MNFKKILSGIIGAIIIFTAFSADAVTRGSVNFDQTSYEYDALHYGSSTFNQATIEAALTTIGTSNKATLLLRPGTWVISSNADWSAYTNVTFKIIPGTVLQIATGTTTTIGGPLEIGLHKAFNCVGTGKVVLRGASVPEVWVEWWGIVSDATNTGTAATGTDASPAFQAAVTCAEASGIHVVRYSAGRYYFGSVVTISRTTGASTKIKGPGMALQGRDTAVTGWITGSAGLKTLFDIGGSANASWSAVEIDGVFLLGYKGGPISGIEFTGLGNSAGRPMKITNCTIEVFTNGILSSGSQSATQVTISNNVIQWNEYNIRSTHVNGFFATSITNNILENGKSGCIYGYFGSTLNITDNMLEASVNAIYILASYSQVTIERNYFELNTGYLIYSSATNGSSTIRIAQNYYVEVVGTKVFLAGYVLDIPENFDSAGIKVALSGCTQSNLTTPWAVDGTARLASTLRLESIAYNSLSPLSATNAGNVSVGGVPANTPLGRKTFINQTTVTAALNVPFALVKGEYVAVTGFLRKPAGSTAQTMTFYVYNPATAYVTADSIANILYEGYGKWIPFFVAIPVPANVAGNWKIKIGTEAGGVFDLTDMYVYTQVKTKAFWPYIPNTGW